MNKLDFLGDSPNLYIFKKKSNDSVCGGVLFLIYAIVSLLILIYYSFDYFKNDKYTIQSFYHFNIKGDSDLERNERIQDISLNPNITFNLDLYYDKFRDKPLDNKFKLYNSANLSFINRNTSFKERVGYLRISVLYECDNITCDDFFNNYYRKGRTHYNLKFDYDGFYIDHQNNDAPIIKNDNNNQYIFKENYDLDFNYTSFLKLHWRNFFYTEKKGFLSTNDYNESCGYIESFNIDNSNGRGFIRNEDKQYYIINYIDFTIEDNFHTEYTRKRISELDKIASLLSLLLSIYNGFKLVYKLYSQNYNNSKIIEHLLDKKPKGKPKLPKTVQLQSLDSNRSNTLAPKNVDPSKLMSDDTSNDSKKDGIISVNSSEKIKKICCCQYLLNDIHLCFKKNKSQKIIDICNEIVYKYISIESIINNQILIENLFQDYNWREPKLNDIEKNDLFNELKVL